MKKIISHTQALCPACRKKVQARIIEDSGIIYLEKFCRNHDISRVKISSDAKWYLDSLQYVKPRQPQIENTVKEYKGCPDSCGFCAEHQQHICLPVIEISDACDMNCPVCLKDFDKSFSFTEDDFCNVINTLLKCEGKVDVINISGGEPTLHPRLENFIKYAYSKGITQVTVSTNGKLLHSNPQIRKMFKQHNVIAALQFDGFTPETYMKFRGEDLVQQKLDLIKTLEDEEIKYSLVCTVASGINDKEISQITDFFFNSKALSLMFQPVCFTGKAETTFNPDENIITIPDIVKEIETSRFVSKGDFNPLPCSHYSCFALSYYINTSEGKFTSLKDFLGKDDFLNMIANKTLPGLDEAGYAKMTEKIYALWSAADTASSDKLVLERIRKIILELSSNKYSSSSALNLGMNYFKAIFIHQFMDVNTLDFGRLIKCCNPYAKADGTFVPICAQNVFKL